MPSTSHNSDRVAGKTIIITGGRGDLGSATAQLLASHGATVVALDITDPTGSSRPDGVNDVTADITVEASVRQAVSEIVQRFGAPTVLVNAAGVLGPGKPAHEVSEEEFDRVFAVNVKGTWLMTKHVVPHMLDAGTGSIINFSSIHGIAGGANVPLYHATKGAVRLMSKADAAAYGPRGIRVNSIHPGSMNTTMSRSAAARSPLGVDEYYRRLWGSNPLPRQGEPIEIAYGVLYLASDESSFTTGSELLVDGGFTSI
ncbi:MAG: SDR family NAD(P)-dependent oxidoreductase [Actinomycetaceae bacterium]